VRGVVDGASDHGWVGVVVGVGLDSVLDSALVTDDCWLVTDDCWLVVLDSVLVTDDCWLVMDDCWLVTDDCWLVVLDSALDSVLVVDDRWLVTDDCGVIIYWSVLLVNVGLCLVMRIMNWSNVRFVTVNIDVFSSNLGLSLCHVSDWLAVVGFSDHNWFSSDGLAFDDS
jgi:hypothetical protein